MPELTPENRTRIESFVSKYRDSSKPLIFDSQYSDRLADEQVFSPDRDADVELLDKAMEHITAITTTALSLAMAATMAKIAFDYLHQLRHRMKS